MSETKPKTNADVKTDVQTDVQQVTEEEFVLPVEEIVSTVNKILIPALKDVPSFIVVLSLLTYAIRIVRPELDGAALTDKLVEIMEWFPKMVYGSDAKASTTVH